MIYRISSLPPSVNRLYGMRKVIGGQSHYTSKRYAAWISKTIPELSPITPVKCEKYTLEIRVPFKKKRKNSDLDNFIKGISDLLVKVGATPNDCNCLDFRIYVADVQEIELDIRPL